MTIGSEFRAIGWSDRTVKAPRETSLAVMLKKEDFRASIRKKGWEARQINRPLTAASLNDAKWYLGSLPGCSIAGHGHAEVTGPEIVVSGVCLPIEERALRIWAAEGPSIEAILLLDAAWSWAKCTGVNQLIINVPEREVVRETCDHELVKQVADRVRETLRKRYPSAHITETPSLEGVPPEVGAALAKLYPNGPTAPFGAVSASIWTKLAFLTTTLSCLRFAEPGAVSVVIDHDQIRCLLGAQQLAEEVGVQPPIGHIHLPAPRVGWQLESRPSSAEAWRHVQNGYRRMYRSKTEPLICIDSPMTILEEALRIGPYRRGPIDHWLSYLIVASGETQMPEIEKDPLAIAEEVLRVFAHQQTQQWSE